MSTYVLVHGAFHAGWCWYKVVSRLAAAGHTALAPDLAGSGRDRTPMGEVSLERWTDDVCRLIDAAAEPVILAGHSRGGIVISEVAERRPDRITALVYVAAMLLRNGETLGGALREDGTSLILPNLVVAEDGLSTTVRPEAVRDVFYGSCSGDDVALATMLLGPEPRRPSGTPLSVTDAAFGSVPRIYVECLRDKAVPLALQRRMYSGLPCRDVWTLDTDHSPFFSAPDALAQRLIGLSDD